MTSPEPVADYRLVSDEGVLDAGLLVVSRFLLPPATPGLLYSPDTDLPEFFVPKTPREWLAPDEMYFGTGGAVPAELANARETAREERMKANRSAGCGVCIPDADSKALLLQRPRSRMS